MFIVDDKSPTLHLFLQLEESESKVIDALNKHNETVTEKNEQILALENQVICLECIFELFNQVALFKKK